VWAVAPSCWNHTFSAPCSSKRASNLGRRKFSSIAHYRSEVTVTVTSSSSKKLRTPHTKPKNGTPHSNLGAVEWPLVKLPRVIVRPVPEMLFVDCERHAASLSANCHFERTLDNKSMVLTRRIHGVNWERHEHSCLATHSPLHYPHPTPSYAAPKLGNSFCRTRTFCHYRKGCNVLLHVLFNLYARYSVSEL
jgi:hypothetical protein